MSIVTMYHPSDERQSHLIFYVLECINMSQLCCSIKTRGAISRACRIFFSTNHIKASLETFLMDAY